MLDSQTCGWIQMLLQEETTGFDDALVLQVTGCFKQLLRVGRIDCQLRGVGKLDDLGNYDRIHPFKGHDTFDLLQEVVGEHGLKVGTVASQDGTVALEVTLVDMYGGVCERAAFSHLVEPTEDMGRMVGLSKHILLLHSSVMMRGGGHVWWPSGRVF